MKYAPLLTLCLGYFMVIIDATIVNVALPSLAHDLHANMAHLQWIVAGYALAFACLLLCAGNLSDRLGAKKVFLIGLSLFTLTSLGCGLSFNLITLIINRLLQGIAAALLVPSSLALINACYTDKTQRAKAIGLWAGIGGIAAAAGPILGAVLTAWLNWRAVFFVNVPVGVIAISLTAKYINHSRKNNQQGFDIAGQVLAIISIAALAISLIEAGNAGWFAPIVIVSFVVFIVGFCVFLIAEQRATTPMFPLNLFRTKAFSISIIIGMVLNIGFYGELFVLPLYFQHLKHYSVLMTGFAILPQTGLVAVASYLSGKIIHFTGTRLPMFIGLIIGALGFFIFLAADNYSNHYLLLVVPLAAIGFGTAFTMPAATLAMMNAVPATQAGLASGALNASRQLGSLIGVAVFGSIINAATQFITGVHLTLIIGGAGFLLSSLFILITMVKF